MVTKAEFIHFINHALNNDRVKFAAKNLSYGQADDVLHNFRETARRVFGRADAESMFRVWLVLIDKHMVALANKGVADHEARDRLGDLRIYSLLGEAILCEREHERRNADTDKAKAEIQAAYEQAVGALR